MIPPAKGQELKWILRGAWAIAGLSWFLWIGYEDRSLTAVQLLSLILSLAFALTALARWSQASDLPARGWLLRAALAGLAGGALTGPMAVLLMMMKTSLHMHPQPDFAAGDLIQVLKGTPLWAVVGLIIGLGVGVLGLAWQSSSR